jgi:hypothetical protein
MRSPLQSVSLVHCAKAGALKSATVVMAMIGLNMGSLDVDKAE